MLDLLLQQYPPEHPREIAIYEAHKVLRYPMSIKDLPLGKTIAAASLPEQREWALALLAWLKRIGKEAGYSRGEITQLCFSLIARKLPFTVADFLLIFEWGLTLNFYSGGGSIFKACENYLKLTPPPHDPEVLVAIEKVQKHMSMDTNDDAKRNAQKLAVLLYGVQVGSGVRRVLSPLNDDDAWALAARTEIDALDVAAADDWNALLTACSQASGASPTDKWLDQIKLLREKVGMPAIRAALLRWFPLVDTPHIVDESQVEKYYIGLRKQYLEELRWQMATVNTDILKGLLWMIADQDDAELARAVSSLVKDSFRKILGKGARLARVGNAGFWSLGQMPGMHGVSQLAILKTRLKLPIIQKQIAAAFDETAKRLNLPQSDIEELVVPTYGLGENGQPVGVRVDEFDGGFRAEIRLVDNEPVLDWYKAGSDKPLSAVPQPVKASSPDEVKDLTQTVKDMRGMLTAQKERIDRLFLAQKSWPFTIWRERYIEHPLVGPIARRLIWKFSRAGETTSAIWLGDALVGSDDQPVTWLDDKTSVELWHPLSEDADSVQGWRRWLENHQVQQPFKQAHREIYVLTDAERNTATYSNRFAAHIIKQHQFSALCAARGWKHQLRLMVDDSYQAPHRILENWGLRVEYWVLSVPVDFNDPDATGSGTYPHLSTDQVRFYPLTARKHYIHAQGSVYEYAGLQDDTPISLDQIPLLVFSELMRDVDLFVGVASVGNDPNWADGGRDVQQTTYWSQYSFGNLSESAKTRRDVLEFLLPRLKIASRCRLDERFLIVQGDLRTYKIHLGSGNILMEPNDQYLCIVPQNVAKAANEKVFLPFEGDQTLSIIISKAFLLANDKAIKDVTITRQLAMRY